MFLEIFIAFPRSAIAAMIGQFFPLIQTDETRSLFLRGDPLADSGRRFLVFDKVVFENTEVVNSCVSAQWLRRPLWLYIGLVEEVLKTASFSWFEYFIFLGLCEQEMGYVWLRSEGAR